MPTKNINVRTYESFSCIKEAGGQESGGQESGGQESGGQESGGQAH